MESFCLLFCLNLYLITCKGLTPRHKKRLGVYILHTKHLLLQFNIGVSDMSKRTNRSAIIRYGNTRFFEKKNDLLNDVGVFKDTTTKVKTTISNMTNPICSEPIRPDAPVTVKKHKLVSNLGYHSNVMSGCRLVDCNNGLFIEPEKNGFKTVFSRAEYEQFKLLCRLYAEQFVNLHGYISQAGLIKMLHDSKRVIVSHNIVRDTVLVMQANEPSMKHNGKTVVNEVCTWSDSSNYTSALKSRLDNIIKSCYR